MGLPDDHRNGPIGVVDQTIWHFTKVETGFLFGYVWRSLNNEFPQNVSRILATMTPTGVIEFYFYLSSKIVNFAKGKYDGVNDTFYDMQTSGGGSSVVHWSLMVRETRLDKILPGTAFTINDIQKSIPLSSLPPSVPEVRSTPSCAVAMQPAPTPPLVCVQAGFVSMPPSDSWYVVPNGTLLAYQLPDDHRNGPICVVDQNDLAFHKGWERFSVRLRL